MRAMIVAAGLGTRLRPLSALLPKPVLPVRGLPMIAYGFELLAAAGIDQAIVNVHHLAERLQTEAERVRPEALEVLFSHEQELLHTGGAIRRVAPFLAGSDTCILLGGDMIVDLDLRALIARHRASGRDVTLVLARNPGAPGYGTIGIDARGGLRRVADRFDMGGETAAGVYTWVNIVSRRALDTLPDREAFNHLDDWIVPRAARDQSAVGAEILEADACRWIPVGTPAEYLRANLSPLRLSYLDADRRSRARGVRLTRELVVGAGAQLGEGCQLRRAVVWDGEQVPPGLRAQGGVFAGGRFHPCPDERGEDEGCEGRSGP